MFIVFVLLTNYFAAILGSEGDTKRASVIVIIGNAINIILDPILIYEFDLGIFGAGLATTIGCLVSFLLFYYLYYVRHDVVIELYKDHFRYDAKILKEILRISIPLVLNGFILTILGLMINYSLHIFSNHVMSFGYLVLLRIQTLMFTPIQGISQGVCIVTAHLTGARRFGAIVSTLKRSLFITVIFAAIFGMIYLFSYQQILSFFSTDINVRNAVGSIMVFSILSFFLQPAVRISNYSLIGLGKSLYSLFSLILNISLFVAFMLIGTLVFKSEEFAIFTAVILADAVQVIAMLLLVQHTVGSRIEAGASIG